MIIRIVRMTFQVEYEQAFLDVFDRSKSRILGMPGCSHLELWRDADQRNVFITHSHWESEKALNAYRNSEFFRNLWKETKLMFTEKPVAFSATKIF